MSRCSFPKVVRAFIDDDGRVHALDEKGKYNTFYKDSATAEQFWEQRRQRPLYGPTAGLVGVEDVPQPPTIRERLAAIAEQTRQKGVYVGKEVDDLIAALCDMGVQID